MNTTKLRWGTVLLSQMALSLKIFLENFDWEVTSHATFTVLYISFVIIKGYIDWRKPSHVTFSPRFFFLSFVIKFSVSLKISIVTLT